MMLLWQVDAHSAYLISTLEEHMVKYKLLYFTEYHVMLAQCVYSVI